MFWSSARTLATKALPVGPSGKELDSAEIRSCTHPAGEDSVEADPQELRCPVEAAGPRALATTRGLPVWCSSLLSAYETVELCCWRLSACARLSSAQDFGPE